MVARKLEGLLWGATRLIGSRKFFIAILIFFGLQASWLAVSAAYPMLYDEYYHPGLIDIYSHQWSPFITHQTPEQTAIYMDITRTPSYLYHYLLSFPYRAITSITSSFYVAIVSMRLINVVFVVIGLILFRKLLLDVGFKKATVNVAILLLVLLPIFPHISAHVNYDNLLFLLTPLFLQNGVTIIGSKKLKITNVVFFLALGSFAILVKYSFLPIFITAACYVLVVLMKRGIKKAFTQLRRDYLKKSNSLKVILALILIIPFSLVAERYFINVVKYKNITPSCQQIQPKEYCDKQPLVRRENNALQEFQANKPKLDNLIDYTREQWIPAMVEGVSTGAVNMGSKDQLHAFTYTRNVGIRNIEILLAATWVGLVASIIFVAYSWREIKRMPYFWFLITIFIAYLLTVWIYINYLGYREVGKAFALQPRYFLLLVPILFAYVVRSVEIALNSRITKFVLFGSVLLIFTQGGGISTYIVRSDDSWYWQRRKIVESNRKIRNILKPLIKEN